jgi:hypothetical protein
LIENQVKKPAVAERLTNQLQNQDERLSNVSVGNRDMMNKCARENFGTTRRYVHERKQGKTGLNVKASVSWSLMY